MSEPEVTVYGAFWCPDCHRTKQFLGEHQIPYHWVDIEEDEEGERFVIEANEGRRRIPTLRFGDGRVLSNPSNAELAVKLGFKTSATKHHYDLIILGGGPAGLTAALYTSREGIDTLVVERSAFGGQAATTLHLDNVPGFHEGITGAELARRFRQQAERFGVELLQAQEVRRISSYRNYYRVETGDGSQYSARALLLAPGSRYRRLQVPGEDDFLGAGVHFCATCDGPFYKGREVAVVGGGNSAAEESLFLVELVEKVTLLVRGGELRASQIVREKVEGYPRIEIRFHTRVEAFLGAESKLHTVRTRNVKSGEVEDLKVPAAFVFIGLDPNTAFLRDSGMRLDERGFIVTGHALVHDGDRPPGFDEAEPATLETSLPGVFAAGDARAGSTKQVASAAGEGAAAALEIREYLKHV